MKEHTLIFQPASVRGIIAQPATKTQSRRVATAHNSLIDGHSTGIKAHWPHLEWGRAWTDAGPSPLGNPGVYFHVPCNRPDYCDDVVHRVYSRIQPGDLVRVREPWATQGLHDYYASHVIDPRDANIFYKADGGKYNWRSPLHLPRYLSRAWLLISEVRGQRLNDITAGDAEAEGIKNKFSDGTFSRASYALRKFIEHWDSINGKKPGHTWNDDPIVWAYSWERVLNRAEADEYLREAA